MNKIAVDNLDLFTQGNKDGINLRLLQTGIRLEYEAISFYEKFAEIVKDEKLKKIFLDVSREEKIHVGEFQRLLNLADKETEESLEKGKGEVDEKLKLASELIKLANKVAFEFPTDQALKKYLKEHPSADKALHYVEKKKLDEAKKKEQEKTPEKAPEKKKYIEYEPTQPGEHSWKVKPDKKEKSWQEILDEAGKTLENVGRGVKSKIAKRLLRIARDILQLK